MIEIENISYLLSSKIQTNAKLEKEYKLKKNSIEKLTGIKKRYISLKEETSESLVAKLCKKITSKQRKNLTHIISVTNTPSIKFPGLSNFASSNLKIENVFCINLNSGCTGYVDAVSIAYDIIYKNKWAKILIITADTYSKFINKKNRSIKPLFSDGASASIIKYNKKGFKFILSKNLNLIDTQKDLIFEKDEISMNGPAVVTMALKHVVPCLQKYSSDVEGIYMHQAGKIVLDLVKSKLKDKLFIPTNYEKYGNLVSSSIPILLFENFDKFKKSKRIILCGFGVGLSVSILKLIR